MLSSVLLGQTVYLLDDHELGVVKEIRGDHFKVVSPQGQDYWFNGDAISRDFQGIHLSFALQDLGHFMRAEPLAT